MNIASFPGLLGRLSHKLKVCSRLLDIRTTTDAFVDNASEDAIQRIYVINLDRKPDRWHQLKSELDRMSCRSGARLSTIARRFSAIDARYLEGDLDKNVLRPTYSLADQLTIDPDPRLQIDAKSRAHLIDMTRPEVAVALSHIEVWKLVAASGLPYTLVLEDDVYFRYGFAQCMDAAWLSLARSSAEEADFDLLFLSYKEVGNGYREKKSPNGPVRRPDVGIWQASGYVLSRAGAQKLLGLLPAYGPIDLWLNLQFGSLNVFIAKDSIIEQRLDVVSTNSYSVMPVLSQLGVHTREKPLVSQALKLSGPVFGFGEPGSGLSALATALSMLGYTCCSDLGELPAGEMDGLLATRVRRDFNAYVNIGSLDEKVLANIARLHPNARFIATGDANGQVPGVNPENILRLPKWNKDKWAALSAFLELEYPAFPYPDCDDIGQRDAVEHKNELGRLSPYRDLKFDSSPWILSSKKARGLIVAENEQGKDSRDQENLNWSGGTMLDDSRWTLRDDTFPSNLALFAPGNFTSGSTRVSKLTIREEITPVRSFTSAAIASKQKFLYGRFSAEIRPPDVSGLITGFFLHRNAPRQEIDIEFLGKDTTKMLVNVFFNPGPLGTKLEYGYRGTPTLIELGFDAAKNFHLYEIEWLPHLIRWYVDGRIVYERYMWNPTPIPDQPMELDVNLWHSRSTEFAGKLDHSKIPAHAEIKSVSVRAPILREGQGIPLPKNGVYS